MHLAFSGSMIAFFLISLFVLGCAVLMLSVRKVIYMALSIGGTFIGAAAIYILLGADFVGVAQILIYAGAITILMLFAIMLTNHEATEPPFRWSLRNIATTVGTAILGLTLLRVIQTQVWPPTSQSSNLTGGLSNPVAIGVGMFNAYALPFEIVSLLLIVALVGAVILAQDRKEED